MRSFARRRAYAVLSTISRRYSSPQGRLPTCYSPVRHSLRPKTESVRLACVRHAASVYPEPGSNSPFNVSYILYDEDVVCILSSDPNQTLRLAVSHKLTETASANSCCTVFHSSIVKVQQYVLSNTTTEIGAFSLSFQTGEELLSTQPPRRS